jgi:iron complex outermembrane receptor protein
MTYRSSYLFSACGLALMSAPPALAKPTGDPEPATGEQTVEIVVTAQRRQERAADVPLAITAIDQAFIDSARLDDVKDLVTFTPGFSGNSDDSYIDGLAIRGITSNDYGIGGDPSIGIFKDGIYQGRTGSAVTSLFDLQGAEALRGPQGFLFGRNAISGAISMTTNKPQLAGAGGHAYVGFAQGARVEVEAAFNLPVSSEAAIRVAGFATRYDGWVDNAFTPDRDDRLMGGNKQAVRASAMFERGGVRATLIVEHERRRLDGTPYRASNADHEVLDYLSEAIGESLVVRGGERDVDTDLVSPQDRGDITSLTALIDADLDFATLSSLTGYRGHRFFYSEDYDGTSLLLGNYKQRQHGTYASQELRLTSPDGGALTWSAGISGYRETVSARFENEAAEDIVCRAGYGYADCGELTADLYGADYVAAPAGVLVDANDARSDNLGLSAFGDLNYLLAPRLHVGAGVRYSWDQKHFTLNVAPSASTLGNIWTFTYFTEGAIDATRHWSGTTPRVYARYAASPTMNLYASLTRGYKAGGFGSFTVDSPTTIIDFEAVPEGTTPDAFAPEKMWSREVGVKGTAFDRRIGFDLTGFSYTYRDLQTVFFDTETRTQQVINVGRVNGHGIEGAISAQLGRHFDLIANVSWSHTRKSGDRECDLRDCGGLANPKWTSSGAATFHQPLAEAELYLRAEWSYQGRRRESFDWRGITRRPAATEVNLRLGYKANERWEAVLYTENMLNQRYQRGAENGGDLTPANTWGVAPPRRIGAELRWRG